jgi:cytochrome c peroxidase
MHDGSLPTLDAVLDHYVRGGQKNPLQDSRVRPFDLSRTERTDLIEFLTSLTDREFLENPAFSEPN